MGEMISSWGDRCGFMRDGGGLAFFPSQRTCKANGVTDVGSLSLGSVLFNSVTQSCPTLCDPMDRSMPGLPVHHHLPEFIQTHVH